MVEYELLSVDQLKEDDVVKVDVDGRQALFYKKGNRVYAYIDVCPHVGGSLKALRGALLCEWHGSRFDVETGKYLSGVAPKDSALIPFPIVVKEGKVYYKYPHEKPRGEWHIAEIK
jgi:nitrite reductase/ring-hydroxylating ferredoxin subunit